MFFCALVLFSTHSAFSADNSQLPLGLKYFMTASEVKSQLAALKEFEVPTDDPDIVAFSVPDRSTKTKTTLFVRLASKGLVEVTSGRYEMTESQFGEYFPQMMAAVEEWKNAGISTVVEDPENMIYVYKDDIQYVTVGASKNTEGYHVYIKFTEVKHEERR
jgi:hypothetical protein